MVPVVDVLLVPTISVSVVSDLIVIAAADFIFNLSPDLKDIIPEVVAAARFVLAVRYMSSLELIE